MPIRPGKLKRSGSIPPVKPDDDLPPVICFSFKLIDFYSNPKFVLKRCADGYLEKLLERLRSVCYEPLGRFRSTVNRQLRNHRITWEETSEPDGFRLNEQLRAEEPWQFEITANEHGRVHGILIDNVFFVVWLDPDHLLYPKK